MIANMVPHTHLLLWPWLAPPALPSQTVQQNITRRVA
jgi:hypothetical protein